MSEWHDDLELDDDVRGSVSKFTSVEELAKGHHAQATLLGDSIRIPKDDATDEERSEAMGKVYSKLGVPASASEYTLDKPDDLPEGVNWDDAMAAEVKTLAHESHMTQGQLDAFVKFDVQRTLARMTTAAEAQGKFAEESTAALKKKIGEGRFDAFVANSEKAFKLADEAVKGLQAHFDETGMKNDPFIVELLHYVFRRELEEDKAIAGAAGTKGKGGVLSNEFYDKPTEVAV